MKEKDLIKLEQLEQMLQPYRKLPGLPRPRLGWIRAIREVLGMSSPQLARRMGIRAAQSVEDMQKDEVGGAITLQTLRKIARALDCELVYALVPRRSLQDIRHDQATNVARRLIKRVAHSMSLEDQAVSQAVERRELERRIKKLLDGNPKTLWD
ncbi:MAG: mobile mystery protein A [Steroidobacteraceae bacterium]